VSAQSLRKWGSPAAAGVAPPPDPKFPAGLNCTVLGMSPGVVDAVTRLLQSDTDVMADPGV